MSQALLERAACGRHTAASAGTTPAEHIHPQVVVDRAGLHDAQQVVGIDLDDRKPQALTRELAERADLVITMGCGDRCPYIPGKRYIDWDLPDPKDGPLEQVRAIRDQIAHHVERLLRDLD